MCRHFRGDEGLVRRTATSSIPSFASVRALGRYQGEALLQATPFPVHPRTISSALPPLPLAGDYCFVRASQSLCEQRIGQHFSYDDRNKRGCIYIDLVEKGCKTDDDAVDGVRRSTLTTVTFDDEVDTEADRRHGPALLIPSCSPPMTVLVAPPPAPQSPNIDTLCIVAIAIGAALLVAVVIAAAVVIRSRSRPSRARMNPARLSDQDQS